MEPSKYGEDERSRNMINVPPTREKSMLEHRSNNVQRTVKNVPCAQRSVSHEEDKILNSHFEHVPSKRPSEILNRMIGSQLPKELKRSKKMMLRV